MQEKTVVHPQTGTKFTVLIDRETGKEHVKLVENRCPLCGFYSEMVETCLHCEVEDIIYSEELKEVYDPVFLILGARALQRHGDGFPSTKEEIEAFKENCEITREEKEHFQKLLKKSIENAIEKFSKT